MASCITPEWKNTAPQARLDVTLNTSASDGDTAVLNWELYYVTHGYAANTNGNARNYTVTIGGTTITGSYNIDGVKSTTKIKQGTVNVAKATSAQNIAFSVSFAFNITWSGTYGGTKSASGSISVPARTTYTVSYNANGGTGAPASQKKTHGVNLTLSTVKPTRTGYSFIGWALSKAEADDGDNYYSAGDSCGKNENLTLYAVWQVNAYLVQYNANGGTGAPVKQTKTYGQTLTLSSVVPTRENYTFKGWATSASATTATYAKGSAYTENAAVTLYAVWELSYVKPRISTFTVGRCLQDGTASDDGTYARVRFDWACDRTISNIVIQWVDSDGASSSTTVGASGTSGSVNVIIGGSLDVEKAYAIEITVQDTVNYSYTRATLTSRKFTIDCLAGGNGVAFGKAAERSGFAEFGFNAVFNGSVEGNAFGLGVLPQIGENEDFNTYLTPGVYGIGAHATAGTVKNNPAGAQAGRLIVCAATGGNVGIQYWSYIQQWYIPMSFEASGQHAIYVRTITRSPNSAPNYYAWLKFTAVSA